MRTSLFAAVTVVAALGTGLGTQPASATIVYDGGISIQQTSSRPCVIGDASCQGPTNWSYNQQSGQPAGQGGTYDLASPVYLAGTAIQGNASPTPDTILSSFNLGIDDNNASGAGSENLVFFKTYNCGASYAGCTTSNATLDAANSYQPTSPTPISNVNGNGYSDAVLTGFNLIQGDYYLFEASVSNDTDGMEEFFLIPTSVPVPEPASLLMLSVALIGLGVARYRKRLWR